AGHLAVIVPSEKGAFGAVSVAVGATVSLTPLTTLTGPMLPNVSVAQAVAARVPSLSVDIDSAFDQAPVVPSATVAPATAGVPDELSSTLTSTVAPGSAVPLKMTVSACWLALPLHASVG